MYDMNMMENLTDYLAASSSFLSDFDLVPSRSVPSSNTLNKSSPKGSDSISIYMEFPTKIKIAFPPHGPKTSMCKAETISQPIHLDNDL